MVDSSEFRPSKEVIEAKRMLLLWHLAKRNRGNWKLMAVLYIIKS